VEGNELKGLGIKKMEKSLNSSKLDGKRFGHEPPWPFGTLITLMQGKKPVPLQCFSPQIMCSDSSRLELQLRESLT
jgi:hypothetical protein